MHPATGLSEYIPSGEGDVERLVILADDFTGACDAAGALAGRGSTLVMLEAPMAWPAEVAVLSVDLDLRERSDSQARRQVGLAALRVRASQPGARVFLKIDSTLRGPIAALIAGGLHGSARDLAVIAPAFPEQGRFLREGTLVVDGQTIGPSLITTLGETGTVVLGTSVARSSESLERAVVQAREVGARRMVVDADTTECLQSVAAAWSRHADWLLVGSGGLARQMCRSTANESTFQVRPGPGRVLVIAGSPTPMTQMQIEHLRPLGPVNVVRTDTEPPAAAARHHNLVVLCTPGASARDAGESARAVADTVLEWSMQQTERPGAIVLAGGATGRLVCDRLGALGVRLSGELAPGVPIGHLVGGVWDGVSVVTKAGGFGTPTTLLEVVRALVSSQQSAEVSHE